MNGLEQHKFILQQIHETYVKKNHDYGNSFSRSYQKYGITAAMVRMEDKWNRLNNLARGGKQMVSGESIRDTLLDLAGYSIMTVMELDKQESNKNQKTSGQQVRIQSTQDDLVQESPAKKIMQEGIAKKVLLHDGEKGDVVVNIPEKMEKKPIDEGKVMALHKAKWSLKKIADEMECSQGRISQIIKAHKG